MKEIETQEAPINLFCCLPLKKHLIAILCLIAFEGVLIVGNLSTKHWVSQGENERKLNGSLLRCEDCFEGLDGELYSDIMNDDYYCNNPSYDGLCTTIQCLYQAGIAYLLLTLTTLIFLWLWACTVILLFMRPPWTCVWVYYLVPNLPWFLFIINAIAWVGIARVKFSDDCETMSEKNPEDLCAKDGPSLALVIMIYQGLLEVYFYIVFCHELSQQAKNKLNIDKLGYQLSS